MAESSRPEPSSPSDSGPLIFVSDETDDGIRLGTVLRTRGYSVADVGPSDLAERSAGSPPSLIVCDADVPETVASVASAARGMPRQPVVIALGEGANLAGEQILPLTDLGADCFSRPVDTYAVLRRVEVLLGAPSALPGGSLMPPSARSGAPAPLSSNQPPLPPSSPSHPTAAGLPLSAPSHPAPPSAPSHPAPPSAPSHPAPPSAPSHHAAAPVSVPPSTPSTPSRQPSPGLPPSTADSSADARPAGPALPRPPVVSPSSRAAPVHRPAAEKPSRFPGTGLTDPASYPSSIPPGHPPSVPPAMPLGLGLDTEGDAVPRQIPQSQMSSELQSLLASAEMRVRDVSASSHPPHRLTPEAEVDAVLPTEILAALEEPLDDDDELDPDEPRSGTGSESSRLRTGVPGSRGGTTGAGARTGSLAPGERGERGTEARGGRGERGTEARGGPASVAGAGTGLEADTGAEPFATAHASEETRGEPTGAHGPASDRTVAGRPPSSRGPGSVATSTGMMGLPERGPSSAPPAGPAWRRTPLPPPAPDSDAGSSDADPSTNPPPRASLAPRDDSQPPPTPVPGGFRATHRPGMRTPSDPQSASSIPPPADSERPSSQPPIDRRDSRPVRTQPPPAAMGTATQATPPPHPDSDEPLPRPGSISSLRPDSLSGRRDSSPGGLPSSRPPLPTNPVFTSPPSRVPTKMPSFSPPSVAMPVPGQELLDEPFDPSEHHPHATEAAAAPLIPAHLGPGDAVRAMALLVRTRYTGAVAFETSDGIHRVVLRDGDFVTAASGIDSHSLTAFLVHRGALAPKMAESLSRRIPQFGRHAGAALVAHGHLRQDELWPVLRAHAEWLVGRTLQIEDGAASLEPDIPARLKAEPAVFGGATGAEVFVELVRRSLSPQEAVRRLGGKQTRFKEGPVPALLGECALPEHEQAHVNRARTATLGEALETSNAPDFAAVLYSLVELGVLDRRADEPHRRPTPEAPPPPDDLDEGAWRARINARLALVEDGDYFAILGVGREATAYDIRRAYTELRREFEPGRALTPGTADLRDEITTIVEVLDEAFDILRDQVRRDRYRRALEAAPV